MVKNKTLNTLISLLYSVALFFFVLTFSIGLPIYFRHFYFLHIEPLKLVEKSGFSVEEIREAYNSMMNYLTLPGKEFSTGVMRFSDEGAAHFVDCKVLFNLNAIVLLISFAILVLLLVLRKMNKVEQFKIGKHAASFYSGVISIVLPLIIGAVASVDFTHFFKVFHYIFFPGKTNWMFNPYTDEIIKVLPQEFFMNCAILIGCSIVIISVTLIIADVVRVRRKQHE